MFFQLDLSAIGEYAPFIMMAILILADILILKLGLVVAKANVKKDMKWVFKKSMFNIACLSILSPITKD